MTESPLLVTPNAVSHDPAALHPPLPPHSPAIITNGHVIEDGDGEDYTIKCICSFPEDDGNTVICEKCDTWQHIACYYEEGKALGENDIHCCVDCEPRKVDRRRADEVQRRNRGVTPEETQRKPKKPGPKPKKKTKNDHLVQLNGHANGHGSPRNGTDGFTKRPKARHQSSSSTTNIPLKLPAQSSRRSASASHVEPSPVKSPSSPSMSCDPNHAFSPEFMHLYDNDTASSHMTYNTMDDIGLTMMLTTWAREADALAIATKGRKKDDVFQLVEKGTHFEPYPLQIHTKVDKNITAHGKHPKWKFLTVEQDVGLGSIMGELHGKVGTMPEYSEEPTNRWESLRHPLPFVFFHPQLPIIIDTREEGSVFRHLRRSCSPNLALRTMLEAGLNDYHFVFSATRAIAKGEELTIAWTTDEHTRRYFASHHDCEVDEEYVMDYCRKVLAEFGGCACNEENCSMAMWAGWSGSSRTQPSKGRKKSARGFGSRSGSEALKQYDDDNDDCTAASTSSHSKPHTRDNTPSSTIDSKNILGEPISEREKRKIAALERRDEERLPDKKKQKRKSGDNRQNSHSSLPTPVFSKRSFYPEMFSTENGSPVTDRAYKSGPRTTMSPLPGSATASPPPPKPIYRENSCQTDHDAASPPRAISSPTRVLPRRAKNPLHRHVFRRSVLKTEATTSPKTSPAPESKPVVGQELAVEQQKPLKAEGEALDTEARRTVDVTMEDAPAKPAVESVADAVSTDPAPQSDVKVAAKASSADSPVIDQKMEDIDTDEIPGFAKSSGVERQKTPVSQKPDMRIDDMPPPAVVQKAAKTVETPVIVESPALIAESAAKALAPPMQFPSEEKSPENKKKKKMSLTEWSRRSSSNVPKTANGDASQDGSSEPRSALGSLKEEAAEKTPEPTALETPSIESGDPMVQ